MQLTAPSDIAELMHAVSTATACKAPATRHEPVQDGTLQRVGCIQRLGRTLIVPDPTLASEEEEDSDMRGEDSERASLWQDVQELVAGTQFPCFTSTKVRALLVQKGL
jgi:hypothetical protein